MNENYFEQFQSYYLIPFRTTGNGFSSNQFKGIQINKQNQQFEGNQAFLNSEYDKAFNLYTNAIQIEDNQIYFNNRSSAYYYLNYLELSLQDCNRALLLNPNYIMAQTNKAQILYQMSYIQNVIQYLEQKENHCLEIEKHLNYYKQIALQSQIDLDELDIQKRLLEWLQNGQALFPKIQIQYYSKDNRGVNAKKAISSKEVILFIPISHMITLEMAKETSVAKKVIQFKLVLQSPKHSFLSIFLLQEKTNQNSFWKPYLDVLPKSYSNFPIFFNDDDLEWLRGSPFLIQIKDKITDLKKDYDEMCKVAPEFFQYSYQQFCWARMTVSSRIFGIIIKGVKTDAFVPLADMFNHKLPQLTNWYYSDERQGFIIKTDGYIEKGQMIFDSYGSKCNSRFLLNYGFVVDDNNANEVNVIVDPDGSIPFLKLKEELIKDTLQFPKCFRLVIDPDNVNIQNFMCFLRFLIINDRNKLIHLLGKNSQFKYTKISFIDIQNELNMWGLIQNICINSLNQYRTTLLQDQEILKLCQLTINQRNCLILRMGEKTILNFYLQFSKKICQLFSNFNLIELTKFQLDQENSNYLQYLNRIINQIKIKN